MSNMEHSEHARKEVLEKDSMDITRMEPVCMLKNELTLVKKGVMKDSKEEQGVGGGWGWKYRGGSQTGKKCLEKDC